VRSPAPSSPARRLRIAGTLVLVLGLAAAGLVFLRTGAPGNGDIPGYVPAEDTKVYAMQMERIGGQANVMAYQVTVWFEDLWRGRELAYTLAVLSLLAAVACFYLADLLSEPPLEEER
jgi:hypothetical protein